MKNLFVLIFVFIAVFAFGQKPETREKLKTYTKSANIIVVTTSDSIDFAYTKIASLIMDYGFNIESSDKNLYFIKSEYSSINNYNFKSRIDVRLKKENNQTKIILKGEAANGGFKFPAANYHRKDVPCTCFAQLFEVAESYDKGIISVETKW